MAAALTAIQTTHADRARCDSWQPAGSHLNCWREDPAKQKGGNALLGLHSNWVGDHVLAMARPWQDSVLQHNLVDVFVRNNIGMILNLQEVGEHGTCGPGVLPSSGFSYDPNTFMAARVGFYNFSWRDMGVPDLVKMMDIVQVSPGGPGPGMSS